MKRFLAIPLIVTGILGFWALGSSVYADGSGTWGGGQMMPSGGGGGYRGMGNGMTAGGMMGSGMMGGGRGGDYGPSGPSHRGGPAGPLTQEKASEIVERHLASTGNPYLKVGKITDRGNYFEAELITKKGGELAAKLIIDKRTGNIRPGY